MVLAGKLSTELGIKSSGAEFFNVFTAQLHDVANICDRIHASKLHEGDDWHHSESVKHWTYVIDGKVHTCNETIEEIDEENKKLILKIFGGDIDEHYKVFKITLEGIDKDSSNATVKWTIEYEKINENIDPPNGYMDYLSNVTRDVDAHLVKT
ncbi:hypothetical protein P8452_50983 [Trifolium repens]|nr:hypothetical protein P8452_50983 [Trifolium repens]